MLQTVQSRAERVCREPSRGGSAAAHAAGRRSGRLTRGGRLFLVFCHLGGLLAALRCLRAELLREPLDSALGVDQLLAAGKERMTVRTDFQVQLGLGRTRLPAGTAGAPHVDDVVFRVDRGLHSELLQTSGKKTL